MPYDLFGSDNDSDLPEDFDVHGYLVHTVIDDIDPHEGLQFASCDQKSNTRSP